MVDSVLFSSNKNFWETPPYVFDYYDDIRQFEWDLAASDANNLAPNYWTEETNALVQTWRGRCWLNSPYDLNDKFVAKSIEQLTEAGKEDHSFLSTHLLIPVRTCTEYFHSLMPFINDMTFIKGRLHFFLNGQPLGPAPFPSMVLHLHSEVPYDPNHQLQVKTMEIKYPKIGRKRDYSRAEEIIVRSW
jgi:phage N-6-adenine-methyltransferase